MSARGYMQHACYEQAGGAAEELRLHGIRNTGRHHSCTSHLMPRLALTTTQPRSVSKSMLQPLPLPVRPSCDASGSSAKHCADGRYCACATTTQKLRRKLASLKVAAGAQQKVSAVDVSSGCQQWVSALAVSTGCQQWVSATGTCPDCW